MTLSAPSVSRRSIRSERPQVAAAATAAAEKGKEAVRMDTPARHPSPVSVFPVYTHVCVCIIYIIITHTHTHTHMDRRSVLGGMRLGMVQLQLPAKPRSGLQ